jgi:hypothetical protein
MFIDSEDVTNDYINCADKPKYHKSFCDLLLVIDNYINDKPKLLTHIINMLAKYFKLSSVDNKGKTENSYPDFKKQLCLVNYWITSHFTKINNAPNEVGYIYYITKSNLNTSGITYCLNNAYLTSFLGFNNMNRRMNKLFNTLCEIFTECTEPEKIAVVSDESQNPFVVNESFIDAEDHSDNNLEDYNDSDDPSTVYKKASNNAKVRMNKTLKKADE